MDGAKGYFYWLADRARAKFDMRTSEGKVAVLKFLLPKVQSISDQLERMTVANDVAGYLGVEQGHGARPVPEGGVRTATSAPSSARRARCGMTSACC